MGLTPEIFIEVCEHWRQCINSNENIPELQRSKFNDMINYLERNYSENSREWSKMIIPNDASEKNMFFANTSNGIEALNRSLNRFVRHYSKNNLTVVGRYIHDFLGHQIEEVKVIQNGDRMLDLSKISTVSPH